MAGIYKIENIVNGKLYVGSTSRSFNRRWNIHKCLLRKNKHHNIHLQRSWNKHGENNFRFDVIEEVSNPTDTILINKEKHFKNLLNASYNIAIIDRPGCTTLGTHLTDEHKQKLRKAMEGFVFTPEHKKKISIGLKKRYKNGFSKEHRKNMGIARRGLLCGDKNPTKRSDVRKK